MKVSKIAFGGEIRIRVEFPYNQETVLKIKQIPDARWSKAIKAWHVPYKKEVFGQLKQLFPGVEYPNKEPAITVSTEKAQNGCPGGSEQKEQKSEVQVEVLARTIIIKLPKNQLDIHFIRSIRYSRWDGKQFCWIVPNYPGNLDLITEYFKERISDLIIWWTIPYSEKFLAEIQATAKAVNLEVLYEEEPKAEGKVRRISTYDVVNYRRCPDEYRRKLIELRYSKNTLRTYCSLFEEFINYYHKADIQKIDEKMIIAFLQYLVMERKISPSYQNQSINAIKFYYERVLGGQRKVYLVERPRRERKLPLVLNEEEISRVIRMVSNIKHKAIIMITYSSGLRLSEVLNLQIKDIDGKRMQVFVRQSKGKKDRYTLLSKKALPVLREYIKKEKPKEWLFEGVKGGKYSESSMHSLVSAAYQRAGITKAVTVHTLRHCFGTHLLENGTDLRYIQALMGHASSKTTEIYTHITTKGFNQIVNPMDKLDV
ncbi:MAG: tyrosine-type recombinase/integrase [Bacteroidales bacterium]|nr:tyrosine-type recombinase/integrase [Bacteroidales bacterium]